MEQFNTKHLFDNRLLIDSQHGFRSGYTVKTNLIDAYGEPISLVARPQYLSWNDPFRYYQNLWKICCHQLKIKLIAVGVH